MASLLIIWQRNSSCGTTLGLAVTLKQGTAEADLKEVDNVNRDWSRSCEHEPDITAKYSLEFTAHNSIIEGVIQGTSRI
jgi:hypothetical protein